MAEYDALLEAIRFKPEWHNDAACRGQGHELFFPEQGRRDLTRKAKHLCRSCPVQERCLEEGLSDPHGLWGGLTEDERRAWRKRYRKNT